ncbi:hypothetical protein AVEN_229050-1 [Araneus ventricosus]|uniref:Uncharacterized protein n=1 Tax=Araneus ventricosus TaxID=182803 RepID=A0A4Y2CYV0_ARAVE|nr:hypothetical protein AVEN_229050-1 [Araneus ventricosus]
MLSDPDLSDILSNDVAKLELQNSFVSAQRQYYLNQQALKRPVSMLDYGNPSNRQKVGTRDLDKSQRFGPP